MKQAIFLFLIFAGLLSLHAADEPSIPAVLNDVLPKIHIGMTISEVETVLTPAYPSVKGLVIKTGYPCSNYIECKLDSRYTLCVWSVTRDGKEVVVGTNSVMSVTREGKEVVDSTIFYLLYEWPSMHHIEIKIHELEKQTPSE